MWDKIENSARGNCKKELVLALKDFYTSYDSRLVDWSATLFDKGNGAYYACSVGRDTEGFLPDVESTEQMLRFLSKSGLMREFGGSVERGLPEWMLPKIGYYAKSIQHPNGYFYQKSWAKESADEAIGHRGRDVGWATCLLDRAGMSPTYDTPAGRLGDGLDADGNPVCSVCVSTGGNKGTEDAPAVTNSYPDYMENKETFTAYLDSLNINEYSYSVGNQLNATYRQMMARDVALADMGAGYSLCEIIIEWLNSKINEDTGYWSEKRSYEGINGFFKIITLYNVWKVPYPARHSLNVAKTLVECIASDEESPGNICSIYNIWWAVSYLRGNAQYQSDEKTRDEIIATLDEALASEIGVLAVKKTHEKLLKYKKSDGGFGHGYYSVAGTHQGLPISTGEQAGDVDATCIGTTGITGAMFSALGMPYVPILMHSDYMRYRNILENLEPTKKIKTQNPLVDFSINPNANIRARFGAEYSIVEHLGSPAAKIDFCGTEGAKAILGKTAILYDGTAMKFEADVTINAEDGARFTLELYNIKDIPCLSTDIEICGEDILILSEKGKKPLGKLGTPFTLKTIYSRKGEKSTALDIYSDGELLSTVFAKGDFAGYNPHAIYSNVFTLTSESKAAEMFIDNLSFYYAKI